ncbi:MAG: restriction endonuclease subunit S [Actinomycetota bacterium]|nr:restriction endonuclease subunit S [Actinomycetota bacterium]
MSELPSGWTVARIGDLISAGGAFVDGDWIESKDQDPEGDVRLIQLADIGDGAFRDRSSRSLTSSKASDLRCTYLHAGDVLVARMPDPLGRACIFPGVTQPAVTAVDVCIVRPGPGGADPRWLMWTINAPRFRSSISELQSGTTRKRISRKNLATIELPVPPLNEQRRIVAAIEEQLSRLDAAYASLQRAELRSEAMRRSVLNAAFAPIDGIRRLGDLAETQLGKMLSAKSRTGVGTHPYVRNKNVQWGRIDLDDVLVMDFSERDIQKFSLQLGDVLVCEGGEVGRSAIWRGGIEGCCYQKALHRVRVGDQLLPEYLVHVMRWLADRDAFDPYVTGSTIKHLPQEDLRLIPVPAPTIAEQRRIVADVEEQLSLLDAILAAVESAKRRSVALRRSILERAFRGELVPQDPSDEPASVLLERIGSGRNASDSGRLAASAFPHARIALTSRFIGRLSWSWA